MLFHITPPVDHHPLPVDKGKTRGSGHLSGNDTPVHRTEHIDDIIADPEKGFAAAGV